MAELVNPYANPYLPAFVNQRPRFNDPTKPQASFTPITPAFSQIHFANGFDGAREYVANNLANGSSEIISESDPEKARIYIVAKEANGQPIIAAYRLVPEEEPKTITMDDLNAKMSELLDRMNKLEEGGKVNAKSSSDADVTASKQYYDTKYSASNRNGQGFKESSNGASRNLEK